MNVGGWALKHRTLVLLVLVVAMLGGITATQRLASGIYPEMEFPRIGVIIRQGDAPPQVFQTAFTRPIEQSLMSVVGVQRVRSETIRGGADIQLQFSPNADMWRALQLVDARLNDVRGSLPSDTLIQVERVTPVSFPILSFNVSGPLDPRDLNELSEYVLRPALARVPGVGRVTVLGGDVREMEVVVDPERAAAAQLRLEEIASRIRHSIPLSGEGRFDQDHTLSTVMASAEAAGQDDIANIPVRLDASGNPVLLGSLAKVQEGAEDRLFRTSGPKGPAVLVSVARLEGASTPKVVADVMAAIETLRPSVPKGVLIEPVYDQGWLVNESIASVRDAIILGVGLCLVVLGVFLRDVRAGFVAALAVPTALAVTFLLMLVLGQTLNLMSLGGMAVAIGLVVDDAIVVVEAIARRLERGESAAEAAKAGTNDLAIAVFGTTVTTVIVFVPMGFLTGVVGKFFGALAVTLASAVIVSMFVALLVVPIAASWIMTKEVKARPDRLGAWVGRRVRWAASHRWLGPLGVVLALAFSVFAIGRVPSGFMPESDEGAFVLDYYAPAGTSLTDTDAAARAIEQILRETPEVATFSCRTGAGLNATTVVVMNQGDFVVRLKPPPRRSADDVMAAVRARVEHEVPLVRAEYIQLLQDMLNDLSGTPRPIEVKVFGQDYAVIQALALDVAKRVSSVPGTADVYNGIERPSSQVVVDIDRVAAARVGFLPDDLAREMGDALLGTLAGSMRRFDRLVKIRVRYPDAIRYDPARLGAMPIALGQGPPVSLSALGKIHASEAPTVLNHEGLQPVVIVTATTEGRDLGSVVRDLDRALVGLPIPQGCRIEMGGQSAGQTEASRNLGVVGVAGLLLVLVVLVAQFGSLRPALAVLLTTPLAVVGALAALWITGIALNVSSLMGCVLLVGLVVKNGILLIEVAEEHAKEGVAYADALAMAAERRFRPIAMTTLATIAGLAPLALGIGSGAEMQRPLAVAVIGGLSLSAILSLAVLPSLAAGLARRRAPPTSRASSARGEPLLPSTP